MVFRNFSLAFCKVNVILDPTVNRLISGSGDEDMSKRQHPDEYEESRNYVVDELALNGGLWPVRMGRLKAGPDYRFPQRMIDYYALHFVINGKVRHRFGDQHIELTSGDVFCAYPGVVYHHFIVPSSQPLEMIWVSIDGGQTPLLLEKAGFHPSVPYISGVIGKELETSLIHLFSQQEDNSSRRQVDLIAAIYRIFGLMIPQKNTEEPDAGPAGWIPRSIEYMNMHYTENINVQDVAAYISVHRAYFSKIFAEQIGMTPIQYLQKLRMERALQLLQQTRHSVSEIAMTLGYPDLYSFSRAFSKHYAASPSKVRESAAKSGG